MDRLPNEATSRFLPVLSSPLQRRNAQGISPDRQQLFDPATAYQQEDVVDIQIDQDQELSSKERPSESRAAVLFRPNLLDSNSSREKQADPEFEAASNQHQSEEVTDTYRRNALSVFVPFPLGGNLDLVV